MISAAQLGSAVLAFLVGAIPFSFLLARIFGGIDIRKIGSGNIGATNLARARGLGVGVLGLALDAAKGVAAILLARAIAGGGAPGSAIEAVAGGAAVLGHAFTPFLRFKGGKGVATGAGVFGVLAPRALLVAVGIFILATAASRMVSLGSVLAAAALPIAALLLGSGRTVTLAALAIAALVVVRHRKNLARIVRGSESRLGTGAGAPGSGP